MNGLEYKGLECKVEDLDKGTVRFTTAIAGNVDHGLDLIVSGEAWRETMNSKEDQQKLKHFREHNQNRLVRFPVLSIEGNKLWATSSLMIKREDGLDTYELYKAAAEANRTIDHSLGYKAQEFTFKDVEGEQVRAITKMMVGEVTTLSAWGMNPLADEFQVKSMDLDKLIIEDKFFNQLLNAKFEDVKLEGIQKLKDRIEKELKSREPKTWLDFL